MEVRAIKVWAECAVHPPPLSWMEKNARDAASVSSKLVAHYHNTFMKAALVHMVYIPRHNFTWCLVPKVSVRHILLYFVVVIVVVMIRYHYLAYLQRYVIYSVFSCKFQ